MRRRPDRPAAGTPRVAAGGELRRLRLMVKIALMYHQRGLSQPRIAEQLGLSQTRVSQLLRQAEREKIVQIAVHVPPGMFSEVEDALEERFGLDDALVVDTGPAGDQDLKRALGTSAAPFLQLALEEARVIGVAAWSETLLHAVEAMPALPAGGTRYVVNVSGGVGPSMTQTYARLTERLARLCHARPVFVLGPGVVSTPEVRAGLERDPQVHEVVSFYDRLSILLVGIGSIDSSHVLRGYASAADQAELRERGAVGDICLHFFDADGRPVHGSLEDRVLGIGLEQIQAAPRTLAVAGGPRKFVAIRAALRGRWVDTLVTDLSTAERLLKDP